MTQIDVLEFLIQKGPGRTEMELAQAIHGDKAYQQRVNQDCNMLVNAGKVERRGGGGPGDPFRYWPRMQ
jgi:predicted transcriptional regulator